MQRVFDFLSEHRAKTVAIFSHVRGDGDCLGAQTGLAEILSSAGFPVALYNQDALSEKFCFMAHYDEITVCDDAAPLPDVCIAVDCATLERIGKLPQAFLARPWINIDHHVSNNSFGALKIVEADASSTCEILARMALDAGAALSSEAATSLYSGISTDTGSFLYPSAQATTFHTAARLLENGADKNLIQAHFWENTSKKKVRILEHLFGNITYLLDDSAAYSVFSLETQQALDVSTLDLEGIVAMIKEIEGVEVAVLFTEMPDGSCKISLRSRDWFDCNRCANVFGGGGHVRASGATLTRPLAEAVEAVLAEITQEWEEAHHAE